MMTILVENLSNFVGFARCGGRLRKSQRQVTQGAECGATARGVNRFSAKGSTNPSGRVNKVRAKVITDYAYAYSICTHGGGQRGRTQFFIIYIDIYNNFL